MSPSALHRLLGNLDLHLLDQILKGRYQPPMRILDAGCGEGRNLPYFVRHDFDIWGVDTNPAALRWLRAQGPSWSLAFDPEKFIEADITDLPLPPTRFDAVICCAVLHFARNQDHFLTMIAELVRILRPGGSLLIRTASDQQLTTPPPDTSSHFLLTSSLIAQLMEQHALRWLEPLRTEQVAGQLAQSTLVLRRS